jgi:hypothetical protein
MKTPRLYPTYSYPESGPAFFPASVTSALRDVIALQGPSVAFLEKDISASDVRTGSTMGTTSVRQKSDLIQLLGRWRSNVMLRYLHVRHNQ